MRKFKTKKENKKIKFILFIMLFLLLFIWISLKSLNNNYDNIVNYLLDKITFSNKGKRNFYNINYLLLDYKFKKHNLMVFDEANSNEYVYLYNTHDQEKYLDKTSVLDVSNYLRDNLNKLGINVIIEEKKVSNYLVDGLNNYEISRKFMESQKENIIYYIDIHRDSVKNTTITINNKRYAKIMFVLGLENPNYLENKKVMEEMNNYLNIHYPGISRGIYEKKGQDVNGIYNQDFDKNVLLIEVGGIENKREEVYNSTEIIALMLYHIFGDNK